MQPNESEAPRTEADMLLFMTMRPTCSSKAELKSHMQQLVEMRFAMHTVGSALIDLNRKYGMLAKELGTSTREVIAELANAGTFSLVHHKKNLLVFPKKAWRDLLKPAEEGDTTYDLEVGIMDATLEFFYPRLEERRKRRK